MRRALITGALALVTCVAALAQANNQAAPADRAASEKNIRAALYEISMATMTGDAAKFKSLSTPRTVKFFDLLCAELAKSPQGTEMLRRSGVSSGETLIEQSFRGAANRSSSMSRDQKEATAREYAKMSLSFVSDTEAKGSNQTGEIRALYVDGAWKLDSTENWKKLFLQTPYLSEESKKTIEKY